MAIVRLASEMFAAIAKHFVVVAVGFSKVC